MKKFVVGISFLIFFVSEGSRAQVTNSQERFQDFFATAGYGTAFGAALGASALPFQENPEKHLRTVAIGASIGFISGSLLGSYIVFSPGIADKQEKSQPKLTFNPIIDPKNSTLKGFSGTWRIASF